MRKVTFRSDHLVHSSIYPTDAATNCVSGLEREGMTPRLTRGHSSGGGSGQTANKRKTISLQGLG